MTAAEAHWWLNLCSFLGIAILSVPVWSLNSRRRALQRLVDDVKTGRGKALADRVADVARDKRAEDVARWRPVDQWCLIAGYLLLLGSGGLRLLVPIA